MRYPATFGVPAWAPENLYRKILTARRALASALRDGIATAKTEGCREARAGGATRETLEPTWVPLARNESREEWS